MTTTIINDVHIGFHRTGGTTPASQEALRSYLFNQFEATVEQAEDLYILGDLFDDFEVSPRDWLQTYIILDGHLKRGGSLLLMAGNHDWTPKAARVSSFQMLADVLTMNHPDAALTIVRIDEHATLGDHRFLGHCSSQELFTANLKALLDLVAPGEYLFLHANYDNNFVANSDHSLNVDRELAVAFKKAGVKLVFAHEHQARKDLSGHVIVLGNQWPTSIIDCKGNDQKWVYLMGDDGLECDQSWTRSCLVYGYHEIDWRELPAKLPPGFVKATGNASSNEASDVIDRISKARRDADPSTFVLVNGVKTEGITEAEDLPDNFEAAKRFDVMEYVTQHLDAAEMAVVQDLMRDI